MLPCGSDTLASFLLPTSSSSVLQGSKSVLDYDNGDGDESFLQSPDKEESVGEDYCEDSCSRPAKKKRLSSNQVESLERNFAVENRLEPERKLKLAKELGLQPRQVAIWFQNRRARFKNKQLEEDYDLLKASYNKLKVDYDSLYKENEVLRTEVLALKQMLLAEEKAEGRLELDLFDAVHSSNAEPKSSSTDLDPFNASIELTRKSDVLDSDSPNGNRCFFIEHADSTHVIELDQADFSKDEADNWNKTLLQPPAFPNFELEYYHDHPPAGCSSFGFTVEDQTLWSSLY